MTIIVSYVSFGFFGLGFSPFFGPLLNIINDDIYM